MKIKMSKDCQKTKRHTYEWQKKKNIQLARTAAMTCRKDLNQNRTTTKSRKNQETDKKASTF